MFAVDLRIARHGSVGDLTSKIRQPLLLRAEQNISRNARGEIAHERRTQLRPLHDIQVGENVGRLSRDQPVKETLDLPDHIRHRFDLYVARLA